jgi:hypothetical protein
MTYQIQIDDLVRNATLEEIEAIEKVQAESLAQEQALLAKNEAKAALLDKLGITAEEAVLLLS